MKQSSKKDTELKRQNGDRQAKTSVVFVSLQLHTHKTGGHVLAAVAYSAGDGATGCRELSVKRPRPPCRKESPRLSLP